LIDSTSSAKKLILFRSFWDGIDDIREVEITGCDFVQHRRKQKEVVAVHKRNLCLRVACQRVIEVHRRM
jgi:hypothetical protein